MKQKDIKTLKEKIWNENNKKCPVLDMDIPLEKMVLDHAHKRNSEEYSETKGAIREALDFRANAVLGKLENSIKRTGLDRVEGFNLGTFLRNAADYFERGAYKKDGVIYIHPTEVYKEPNLSKSNYNKCKKAHLESGAKKKFPDYPKRKKATKTLIELFKKYNIPLYN